VIIPARSRRSSRSVISHQVDDYASTMAPSVVIAGFLGVCDQLLSPVSCESDPDMLTPLCRCCCRYVRCLYPNNPCRLLSRSTTMAVRLKVVMSVTCSCHCRSRSSRSHRPRSSSWLRENMYVCYTPGGPSGRSSTASSRQRVILGCVRDDVVVTRNREVSMTLRSMFIRADELRFLRLAAYFS